MENKGSNKSSAHSLPIMALRKINVATKALNIACRPIMALRKIKVATEALHIAYLAWLYGR